HRDARHGNRSHAPDVTESAPSALPPGGFDAELAGHAVGRTARTLGFRRLRCTAVSDKPKATSATASEGETSRVEGDRTVGEQANRAAGTGRGVTSPMDNPTEQFSAVRAGDVPRTDEELGLEPDVPTVRDRATAVESAEAAASGGATAARTRGRSGETRKAASLTKKPTATDPASEAETTALPKTTASPKTTGAPKTAAVPQDAAVSQDAAVPEDGADRTTEPIDDGGETAAYAYASIPPAANTPGERSKSARRRPAEN